MGPAGIQNEAGERVRNRFGSQQNQWMNRLQSANDMMKQNKTGRGTEEEGTDRNKCKKA